MRMLALWRLFSAFVLRLCLLRLFVGISCSGAGVLFLFLSSTLSEGTHNRTPNTRLHAPHRTPHPAPAAPPGGPRPAHLG